jgi:cation diffusion facilitator CzcD-associated flavoprotein CzcO
MNHSLSSQVAIIGAGPYGLAAAAHLRAAQVECTIFGEAMEFWDKQMPEGMMVRSVREASHIADPQRARTLDHYLAAEKFEAPHPLSRKEFVRYGKWFQRHVAPDLDSRRVREIEKTERGFRLRFEDETEMEVQRVVVATGIANFARRPSAFDTVSPELVSHTCENRSLNSFAGQRVIVVGGGQSAIESAALLHEAGAEVEVVARQPRINWLDQKAQWLKSPSNPFRALLYPPTDVGPPGLNWIVATPALFRQLPSRMQDAVARRSIRPAASGWLVPRMRNVPIATSCRVAAAREKGGRVHVLTDDGGERSADHVLLATGFQVDVSRYGFLSSEILRGLRLNDGYPVLKGGLESSVPGLHFLGAPAARSFGPLCRFVSGTAFAGAELARGISRRRSSAAQPAAERVESLAAA